MTRPHDYPARAQEAFNRRNLEALTALWAPGIHYVAPGEETTTRAAALAREQALFTAFPDIVADLGRHHWAGERLVIEGELSGTHDGELRLGKTQLPATGRRVVLRFAAVFAFDGGVVATERVYYDRLDLLQQLGVVPA